MHNLNEKVVAVVDAVSTGNKIAKEFHSYGLKCVHITSKPDMIDLIERFMIPEDFIDNIIHQGNISETISKLSKYNIYTIIPGCETGVTLSEHLSSEIELENTNKFKTNLLRRNKFHMHERLKKCGLRYINQTKCSSYNVARKWVEESSDYPIVIKPQDGACSNGVVICENHKDLEVAFKELLNTENILGLVNEELLLQEYVEGTQYFVNTVSFEEEHYVTDIWQHDRSRLPGGAFRFEAMTLCDYNDPSIIEVIDYTLKAISALKIEYGAAHTEVLLTKTGAVLIETNARLMGASIDDKSFIRSIGYTQSQILSMAYMDHGNFKKLVGQQYQLKKYLCEISFIFFESGTLIGFPGKEEIMRLESFFSFVGVPTIGTKVKETRDTLGTPGYAYLLHNNPKILKEDKQHILKLQKENKLFTIQ